MSTRIVSFLLLLFLPAVVWGANTHGQQSEALERGAWFGDGFAPYIVSGCAPVVPGSGLILAAFACTGYAEASGIAYYITQAAVGVTVPNSATVWLALHRNLSDTPTGCGGGNWVRVAGTHYLTCANATQPAEPVGGLVFTKVTVAGSNITALARLATSNPALYPESLNAKAFGVIGDGVANDAARIQHAIDLSTTSNLYFPCGTYALGTTTIELKKELTIRGEGRHCVHFTYSGTGDAFHWRNTSPDSLNGSGFALLNIEDIYIEVTNSSNAGAAIDLVGSWSYFNIRRIRIAGFPRYGIILDQSELVSITDSIIESNNTHVQAAHIWMVSDNDHTAAAAAGAFVNIIHIERNQFNGARYGIIDDGGNQHHILHNNFNANSLQITIANVTGLEIGFNSFESSLQTDSYGLLFQTVGTIVASAKGTAKNGVIQGNNFSNALFAPGHFIGFTGTSFHTGFVIQGNFFESKLGRNDAIELTRLAWSVAWANTDNGTASVNHYASSHNDVNGNVLFPPGGSTLLQGNFLFSRTGTPVELRGGLQIGASSPNSLGIWLFGSVTWDPANIAASPGTTSTTITVTGALVGDRCTASHSGTNVLSTTTVFLACKVTAADTATVILYNGTGGAFDGDTGTLRVEVTR